MNDAIAISTTAQGFLESQSHIFFSILIASIYSATSERMRLPASATAAFGSHHRKLDRHPNC